MKKLVIILVLILITGAVITVLSYPREKLGKVKIGNNSLKVEIADTLRKQVRGLMFRKSLSKDRGMLFVFDKSMKHSIWMKNTLIPLDVIWIDDNFKIIEIKTLEICEDNLCQIHKPKEKARYVLETNSGWAKKNNIKIGDLVELFE